MDLNIQFQQSPSDKNTYKLIRLPNELDCLLIHDPEADKSAASLSVDTGDCDDPSHRPGMAHFLEHMLFMGTEKYPDQNAYSAFINKNSGMNNAYTSRIHTNYYLDCSNEAFSEALDRFAQFFVAPLLNQSCVDRELNAVNSENEMCIITDAWREYLLWRTSMKKGHPYCKFPVGNLKSLQHPTIRDEVLQFYQERYSSNQMRLCVYSKADINTLEDWVKTHFTGVPNKKYERRVFKELPFTKEHMGNFYKVVPIKDNDYLELTWVFGSMYEHYKNNPLNYLSFLFGHEGENSLLSFLKEEGLATELSAGTNEEMQLFTSVDMRIKLTPYGYENYKDVLGYALQYVNMIKNKGAQKWIFDEIKKVRSLKFNFLEKASPSSTVTGLSQKLLYYPYEDVLKLNYFMENYNEDLINQTIQGLTLDNLRVSLISKKCEPECNLVEEWYGVKHTYSPVEQYVIDYCNGKNYPTPKRTKKRLDLPPKNIFLPENFDIFSKPEDNLPDEPKRIKDEKLSEVWFKRDHKFFVPKANIYLNLYFRDGSFGNSVETYVLAKLWQRLFEYHTQEMVYLASEANVNLSFKLVPQGYNLDIRGFNDTLFTVAIKFFEKLLDFKPQELKEIYKDLHYDELQKAKNFIKDKPYLIARTLVDTFAQTGNYHHPNKTLETLQNISFEDLLHLHSNILQRIKLQWFFSGNLIEDNVKKAVAQIEELLTTKREGAKCNPLEGFEIPEIRVVQIPDNSTWIYEYNLTRENQSEKPNPNSGILELYQMKIHNDKTRMLSDLLNNYLKEMFFDQLRTNEQLGYVVASRSVLFRGVSLFFFLIQSDVKWPQFLRQRIAAFVETLKEKVRDLSDDEYKKYIESVKTEYLQKPLKLSEEADRHWEEIKTMQFYFNRRLKYAELLPTIPKQDFQDFIADTLFNSPRKFEIHVISELMKEENDKLKSENKEDMSYVISDDDFKKKMNLYPDYHSWVKPQIKL